MRPLTRDYLIGLLIGALVATILIAGFALRSASKPTPLAQFYVPSHAPLHKAPPAPAVVKVNLVGGVPQVYGLRTRDTGVDISRAINDAANHYGFSAPGFAALIGTESAFRQYAPHYPIYGAGACDYSAGLTQITVCTAAGLGIGNGSQSQANINYVFWYEQQDPVRDIWFSAKLIAQFKSLVCVDWTFLYVAWNAGPSYGCGAYFYSHPSGMAYGNYSNYLGWWRFVWANYTGSAPTPRPAPTFSATAWNAYRVQHHRSLISYLYHGRYSWAANVWVANQRRCGGVVARDHYYNDGHGGYSITRFQHCRITTWPRFHTARLAM